MAQEDNPKLLIESAKNGDKAAFERLYLLYFTPVFRYVYLRVKNKAEVEEITQDVFYKVYKNIGNVDVVAVTPLAYFFTVARNTIIDYWRKNRSQVEFGKEDVLLQMSDSGDNPKEASEKKEAAAMLYKAMNKLTNDQREVLTLKYWSGISNSEIAGYMEKTEEAVRQLQSRGMRSLREVLIEMNQE